MRILLAGTAAAAFAFAATPAFAQFGGSPTDQVEGAPGQAAQAPDQDDDEAGVLTPAEEQALPAYGDSDGLAADADADPDADVDNDLDADAGSMAGKVEGVEGEQYALANVDADMDVDADVDADADVDVDVDADIDAGIEAGEAQPPAPDEAYEDGDEAAEEAAPAEQGDSWQGEDGQAYCRRSDGTTGLIVGGGAGALVGREIGRDGRHSRRRGHGGGTTGTIVGGIIGAVVGSAIERSADQQNCR